MFVVGNGGGTGGGVVGVEVVAGVNVIEGSKQYDLV